MTVGPSGLSHEHQHQYTCSDPDCQHGAGCEAYTQMLNDQVAHLVEGVCPFDDTRLRATTPEEQQNYMADLGGAAGYCPRCFRYWGWQAAEADPSTGWELVCFPNPNASNG